MSGETIKRLANEGIDAVGGILIDKFLPADGYVKNALKVGLDRITDVVFDPEVGEEVPIIEHSEIKSITDALVPVIIGLVDRNILKVTDIPFLNESNEKLFEQGLLLQLEAVLRQIITDFLVAGNKKDYKLGPM